VGRRDRCRGRGGQPGAGYKQLSRCVRHRQGQSGCTVRHRNHGPRIKPNLRKPKARTPALSCQNATGNQFVPAQETGLPASYHYRGLRTFGPFSDRPQSPLAGQGSQPIGPRPGSGGQPRPARAAPITAGSRTSRATGDAADRLKSDCCPPAPIMARSDGSTRFGIQTRRRTYRRLSEAVRPGIEPPRRAVTRSGAEVQVGRRCKCPRRRAW
jgi:hypothetical protein